jgi:hypothetical protein
MGEGDDGPFGPPTNDQALEFALELRGSSASGPGDLAQDRADVTIARCGFAAFALAGRFVVARAHAGPLGESVGGSESGHVDTDFHQELGGRQAIDTGDSQQQLHGRLISFSEPIAIVFGAVLALFGTVLALWLTGTSLNIVSLLGAIIGVGIVAKNGILMLDFVDHLLAEGLGLEAALVQSGRRRLRPVLMTALAAALGLLPLAYGLGAGADMLKPLAIAVIGALCISALLSLIATPTVFFLIKFN